MTAETSSPRLEKISHTHDFFSIPQALLGLAEKTKQYSRKTRYLLLRLSGKESKNSVWNSRYLIESVITDERYQQKEVFYHRLQEDFFSYLDEVVYWKTPWYPYDPYGISQSYLDSIDVIGQNFVEDQEKKGHTPSRAKIELEAMSFLNQWMQNPQIQPGSMLIWYSPRGKKSEGYLGLQPDKPVKVNVYIRQKTGCSYRQYTTWSSNTQLKDLQNQMKAIGGKSHSLTDQEKLPEDCAIINNLTLFDQEITEDILERLFYQNEESWPKNRSDAPLIQYEVNYQTFIDFRQQVFDTYFSQITPFITGAIQQNQSFDEFIKTSDYKKMLLFFDQQFSLSASSVLKMVENEVSSQSILNKLAKTQEALLNQHNKVATDYDTDILQSAATFFTVSNQILSLSQCGIMSPFTTPISLFKNSFNFSFSLMPLKERELRFANIKSRNYVELDLRQQGASQVWMVPSEYLKGAGCRVGKDGKVYGPCIIPNQYPNGIPLDDPLETIALPMNQVQFEQYKLALAQSIYQDQFNDLEQQVLNTSYLTDDEKTETTEKLKTIGASIIKKSIGLMEFIAGGPHLELKSLLRLPAAISYMLVQCRSVSELMSQIDKLGTSKLNTELA